MRAILALPVLTLLAVQSPAAAAAQTTAHAVAADPAIAKAVADPARSAADRARDKYRHPAQTLSFFGLKPDMTVVELFPSGGWYSAILAPYLAAHGRYIAAVPPGKSAEKFDAMVAGDRARYGKVETAAAPDGVIGSGVVPGTADMVLTFRNIHNLLGKPNVPGDGTAPAAFASWYAALKPGGVLGIVEHRLPEQMDTAAEKTSGYVKRSTVIRLATAAGFRLAAASEINENPKDTHDWPEGVWTLPPTYALGAKDRAKYAAIGESDRMTLKFVKPSDGATGG